jgi:hypothetical protein
MTVRVEHCACGTAVRAERTGIAAAVRQHNESPAHREWRERDLPRLWHWEGWHHVVVGPTPCQRCRCPVAWDGQAWCERGGLEHRCTPSDGPHDVRHDCVAA